MLTVLNTDYSTPMIESLLRALSIRGTSLYLNPRTITGGFGLSARCGD